MRAFTFVAAAAFQAVTAVNLYAASYDGNVTSVTLSSNNTLSVSSQTQGCGSSPSWLVQDKSNKVLYCIDEGNLTPNGSVAAYTTSDSGKLTLASHLNLTAPAPVSGVIFGSTTFRGMAIAHYTGQLATIAMSNATSMKIVQQTNFTAITPLGPDPKGRQFTPHEHQAITDPSGKYILMPDLGADLVRVFCWGATTDNNTLAEHPPLVVAEGSGPRHAVFWQSGGDYSSTQGLYLFVVAELANSITAYKVSYPPEGGMKFTESHTTSTFGNATIVPTAGAGEITVSPDNRFLIVSNRNDKSFTAANGTAASDSLASFAINVDAGLVFKGLSPAGGSSPRQFSINKAGDMVAVSLTNSARMVILSRNVATGAIGGIVASLPIGALPDAGPTCVVWDE